MEFSDFYTVSSCIHTFVVCHQSVTTWTQAGHKGLVLSCNLKHEFHQFSIVDGGATTSNS